jgi:hypothetical protein
MAPLPESDIADWVRCSRASQGLTERITDPDTIAALAHLVRIAQDTEAARQGHGDPWAVTPAT